MKYFLLAVTVCLCLAGTRESLSAPRPMHVVFLNPGSQEDIGMWGFASHFMTAAAEDLGIELKILYADRNHMKMLEQAWEVSRREEPPDYVVLVNEKQSAGRMLSFFKGSSSRILLMHNDLTPEQRAELGGERQELVNWIATVTTDERKASRMLIDALSTFVPGPLEAVGISGIQSNPVSSEREAGLKDFFLDPARGRLLQIVHADWSHDGGISRAGALIERHPGLNAIWAANDSMAMGAFDAIMDASKGMDVAVGGLGGFPTALESIGRGGLKVTIGGHVMIGAWALVLLYDYHHGQDFAEEVGMHCHPGHLAVIDTPEKAAAFREVVIEHPERIDFRRFSKHSNKKLARYDFSYQQVCEAAGNVPCP